MTHFKRQSFRYFFSFSVLVALSACGELIGQDKGLFADNDTGVPATLTRPSDIGGVWEWQSGPASSTTSAVQATYGVSITRTRIRINSTADTLVKVSTLCERRDVNDSNKILKTYINSEAWVRFEADTIVQPAASATTTTTTTTTLPGTMANGVTASGRLTLNSFRDTTVQGEQAYACVPSIDAGIYAYQVQNGVLYFNFVSPIQVNSTFNNQVAVPTGGMSSFRKISD